MIDVHVQNTEKGLPNHQPDPTDRFPTGSQIAINEIVPMFQPNDENHRPREQTTEERSLASPVPCSEDTNDSVSENASLLASPSSSSMEDTLRKEVI